ncbi:MAG: hypothetical protein Q8O67_20550 [Deltaproteobacteria bacterium]|nr:hypothetical protein [Deltaproteobacteria bacterium]
MKSLNGASVVVEADRFEIDLNALVARTGLAEKISGSAREAPSALLKGAPVSMPGLAAVVVETGGLSLRELLGAADSGNATVRIPLVPQTIKIGPLGVELEAGSRIVLDLVVSAGGIIERTKTKGRLEPGLKLPLGVVVQGVYVDPAGNIVADVERFPDVNLSMLALHGLRLPESLNEVLALIFESKKPADDPAHPQPALIDLAGIEVEATDVVARAGPIALGAGVVLSSGEKTRLDISWAGRQLRIAGVVDVVSADVRQPAVELTGVSGQARVEFSVGIDSGALRLSIDDAELRVATVTATVGDSVVVVEEVGTQQPARARIERPEAFAKGKLKFSLEIPSLAGKLREGVVVVDVGDRRVPICVQPGHVSGSVVVSERHHKVDVRLVDVGLSVDEVAVQAPLVFLQVQRAQARATGRLVAGNELGVAFSGGLVVDATISDAIVNAGVITARGQGQAHVTVDDVAVSSHGLELLVLRGSLELALASGRVPLFSTSLELLPGAVARVDLHRVALQADAQPQAEGAVVVEATAAECVVDHALLVVPGSACRLAVPRFVIAAGLLVAENLHASVRTS